MPMIYFKIIAILITTGAGLLQIGLEYKWHDKRTKKHKIVRSILIIMMIAGFLSTLLLVIYDDRQSESQIRTLNELKETAEGTAKKSEENELKAIKDREQIKQELENLQRQIEPVVKLATEKYPTLDINEALSKIADDVQVLQKQNEELKSKTKELEEQDYFHPLNSDTKSIIVHRLGQIIESESYRDVQIAIVCESGNTNRQKVAKQLVDILSQGGLITNGPTSAMHYSSGVLPPVSMYLNPADEEIARQLASVLNLYLNVKFTGKGKDEYEQGRITIEIYGDPIFSEDGIVTFP